MSAYEVRRFDDADWPAVLDLMRLSLGWRDRDPNEALFQWKWLILHWTDHNNDHGDGVNHRYWATRGFNSRNPSVCNTFAVGSAKVQ